MFIDDALQNMCIVRWSDWVKPLFTLCG